MARLIDADKLVEAFEKAMDALFTEDDNGNKNYVWSDHICIGADIEDLVECIKAQPTIEAESVRHGQWEHLAYNKFRCTACERASYVETVVGFPSYEYCPHCGAKMDKKSPENHKKYQEEEINKKAFK